MYNILKEQLIIKFLEDRDRLLCPAEECEFVLWDNPVPVVAAIVEYEGKVILANNAAWPDDKFALITGFLEQGESPEEGVLREVHEELGLIAEIEQLIGVYPFIKKNQLIMAYHVTIVNSISSKSIGMEFLEEDFCVKINLCIITPLIKVLIRH